MISSGKHSFTTKGHDYKFNLHPKLLNKKKKLFHFN